MYRPPDPEPRVYGPQRIAAVVATLAEDGIDAAQTLEGSGLDEATLSAPTTRVSYAQVATVFRNAVHLMRDPTVALRAGLRMRLTAYGMYGYALLSSPTRGDAIDFAVKYHRSAGPVVDISVVRDPSGAAIYHYEVLLSADPLDELYRFTLEFAYTAHLTMTRDMYGKTYGFSSVSAVYPAPAHAGAYRKFLHCPVRFSENSNDLRIDAECVGRPSSQPDLVTHAMARDLCQQFLASLSHAGGFAAEVRRHLVEQMPWRFPSIESMARELAMEPRTLRRRLDAQGTSYRQILADVRQGLAIEYLRKTHMTNEEIASRLGYSDAANFRHAFARWTGKCPSEFRGA